LNSIQSIESSPFSIVQPDFNAGFFVGILQEERAREQSSALN
jgi:hypothetical protein